jgi:tetratricopeptide (TPR) repeat protein
LYKRGFVRYKQSQFDSALDDYRRFLTECDKNKRNDLKHKGFFGIGCVHATLNQHEQAIRCFGDAIKSSKGSSEDKKKLYYLHRGRALGCCARYSEAKADLDLVIEQSNDHFVKGCAYNELDQHQLAVEQFDYLLENKS